MVEKESNKKSEKNTSDDRKAIEEKIREKKTEESFTQESEEAPKITDLDNKEGSEENVEESEEISEEDFKKESTEKNTADKKKELMERAKKLSKTIEGEETEGLKDKVKIKKRTDMLIPLEDYVRSGIYIGTRAVTPDMKQYVYRRRADGLAIFNTDIIDEKLKEGIEYLSQYKPEDIILVCKREAGWRAVEKFAEITGIRVFTKKYPAGILTNPELKDFTENKLTFITDAWVDRNALNDTLTVNKDVLMICDTNNFAKGANKVMIGNNKNPRSLGVIFYLLTRGYCKAQGIPTDNIPDLEWWTGEID